MGILLQVFWNWFIGEDDWSRRLFKEKSVADKQEEDFGEWRPWVCGAKISFIFAIHVCPEYARLLLFFFSVDISRFLFCPLVVFSCELWKDVNIRNLFSPLSKGFSFWCLSFCFMLSQSKCVRYWIWVICFVSGKWIGTYLFVWLLFYESWKKILRTLFI
jgi:hypothetical protein